MLIFGDFSVHHKVWLTFFGGIDRPGELSHNFFISDYFTHMVNFATQIPDCDSHNLALLDLFISSDAIICSTIAFSLQNSDHVVVVSASINFLANSKRDAPFYLTTTGFKSTNT